MRPVQILPPPPPQRRRRRKKRSWLLGLLTFAFASGVVLFLAASAVVGFYVWKASRDLPDYERLAKYEPPGDDAHPRQRRHADGRVCARAAHFRADQCRSEDRHPSLPGGRGPALLRARRPGLHGHRPRALQEFPELGQAARRRRLHHHAAGRQELPADQQAGPGSQAEGGDARHPHRAHLPQGEDSRALSQRDLSRHGLLRDRRRSAQLFRQGAGGAGARGGGLSRRAAKGAQQLPSLPQGQGGHRAAQLDPRPDGRERLRSAPSRPGPPRPRRSRSTSARSARKSTPPTTSPRKCGAGSSRCTARTASTAAPSARGRAATASTAACRSARRSTPICRGSRAGC